MTSNKLPSDLLIAAQNDLRNTLARFNPDHPVRFAAQAQGHLKIPSKKDKPSLPPAHNGQAITAQQHEQLG
jgi:hypothetical protein